MIEMILKSIDMPTIMLAVGLTLLVAANSILGALDAALSFEFDAKKLMRGLAKGAVIVLCFLLVYVAGALNPDVVAVEVGGAQVNLLTAVYMIVLAGFYYYAKQVVQKLIIITRGDKEVTQINGESIDDKSKDDLTDQINV